jgi:hypothetical protein
MEIRIDPSLTEVQMMMKKESSWQITFSLALISGSILMYLIHYLIFRDVHHIFLYMIGDIAFLFLDVLLVILFIERVLSRREKRLMMKKLNMVIGTFFSEVGLDLLKSFSVFIENSNDLQRLLEVNPGWKKRDYDAAREAAQHFPYTVRVDREGFVALSSLLAGKRSFLLRLLENPNLLEHERFTDLLWAVFHLSEELAFRQDKWKALPASDYQHLAGDLKRAFSQITREWVSYLEHLKESYPFLFSLAARVNPLSPNPNVIVS